MGLKGHVREIVLGAALVVLLFWLFRPAAPPPPAAEPEQPPGEKVDLAAVLDRIVDAEFNRLQSSGADTDEGVRNLFDYGVRKPPPPSKEELARMERAAAKRAEEEEAARLEAERLRQEALLRQQEEAQRIREEQRKQAALNPPKPAKPTPPSCDLKLFGLVGERGRQIAIFMDGDAFVTAREGETVKEVFRVEKIGYDSLRLGYTDPKFKGESVTLTLGSSS